MSDLTKTLTGALANPNSLSQQTSGRGYFLDDHSTANPSEGNMLTLLTMRDLFKKTEGGNADEEEKASRAIASVAQEESRFLLKAMQVLTADNRGDAIAQRATQRLKDKFGKDFAGASELAKLLKAESIRNDFEEAIKPHLLPTSNNKSTDAFIQ